MRDYLYTSIEGLLDWLIRFAVAIRKAASHNRDVKSEKYSDPNDEGFEEFQDTTRTLLDSLRAKRLLREGLLDKFETVMDLVIEQRQEDVYQRVIEGNVRRRKRFLYARSHDEHFRSEPLMKEKTTLSSRMIEEVKETSPVQHLLSRNVQGLPSVSEQPNLALAQSVKSSAYTTATSVDPDKLEPPHDLSSWKPAATVAVSAPAAKVEVYYPSLPKHDTGNKRLKCPYCCLPVELATESKLQKEEKEEKEEIWR